MRLFIDHNLQVKIINKLIKIANVRIKIRTRWILRVYKI